MSNKTYKDATDLLDSYFSPKKDTVCSVVRFIQMAELKSEPIAEFIQILRITASDCEFGDATVIKAQNSLQVIQGFKNQMLRKRPPRKSRFCGNNKIKTWRYLRLRLPDSIRRPCPSVIVIITVILILKHIRIDPVDPTTKKKQLQSAAHSSTNKSRRKRTRQCLNRFIQE